MAKGTPGKANIVRRGVLTVDAQAQRDSELNLSEIGRDASVLDDDAWRLVDDELVNVLREQAIFPELLNELGITREITNWGIRRMDVWETDEGAVASVEPRFGSLKATTPLRKRSTVPFLAVYADVQADPEDVEAAAQGDMDPLEATGIREATEVVVDETNKVLATGSTDEGVDGLLNRTSRTSFTGTDWTTAGNGLKDLRGMGRRLFVDNVPEGVPKVAFVNPTNYEELLEEKTNTLGSQIDLALKSVPGFKRTVQTNRRTVGTATMVAMSRSWLKHVVSMPVSVHEMTASPSKLVPTVFRVAHKFALFNAKKTTVVDATAV